MTRYGSAADRVSSHEVCGSISMTSTISECASSNGSMADEYVMPTPSSGSCEPFGLATGADISVVVGDEVEFLSEGDVEPGTTIRETPRLPVLAEISPDEIRYP